MRTATKLVRRRWRVWTAGAAAAVVTLVGGWATPASANPPVVIMVAADSFKLRAPQVDFGGGTNLNLLGDPANNGHLYWMQELTNPAVVWPWLSGSLFINNAAGLCARVGIEYRANGGVTLATRYGGTVCATSNQKHVWSVDLMPYGSADIDYVHVLLQTVAANGSATTVAWQRLYP